MAKLSVNNAETSLIDVPRADRVMLTTVDNPYDPFTDFDRWLEFDEAAGYFTNGLLARLTYTSDELSDADQLIAYESAIDEIIQDNFSGVHKKVYRKSDGK